MTDETTLNKRYHRCYNNDTYKAFGAAIRPALGLDPDNVPLVPTGAAEQEYSRLMNLMIDAAYEVCGSEYYRGACLRLGIELRILATIYLPGYPHHHVPVLDLLQPALDHLGNFSSESGSAAQVLASLKVTVLTMAARAMVERAAEECSLLADWKNLAAYSLLWASADLLRAAELLLAGEPSVSYIAEKLTRAAANLKAGWDWWKQEGERAPYIVEALCAQLDEISL